MLVIHVNSTQCNARSSINNTIIVNQYSVCTHSMTKSKSYYAMYMYIQTLCLCINIFLSCIYIYINTVHECIYTGNVETGKKEVVFSGHRKGIEGVVGHKGHVMDVAISSDGNFLVSKLSSCKYTCIISTLLRIALCA